jgi:two-component system response regulator MtrA
MIERAGQRTQTAVGSRILVIEDDASLRESLLLLLEANGFAAEGESDGAQALRRIATAPFDLLVLDLMLPSLDGLEICRAVRRFSGVPILFLTARTETSTLVAGLELGADDYMTKPFEAPELIARIRALLRRLRRDDAPPVIATGDLEIDVGAFRLRKRGRPVQLSATEFRLLVELADHAGQVLTRPSLLERVWGYDYLGDSRLVDMAVKRLRDKIEDDPKRPRYLVTVRGVGYRFETV